MHTQVGKNTYKGCAYCTVLCLSDFSKCNWQHAACEQKRKNTPGRCSLYFILYRFISSSTCAYRQCSFCLTPFTATQATSHGYCVCGCRVAQRNVPQVHIQSHHTCSLQFSYCFFPLVPVLNAEKIDIQWSIAKRSKYCPPQKVTCPCKTCWTSHCLHEMKRLSLQVQSLGL